MSTYGTKQVICAVCEAESVQTTIVSASRAGAADLDLRAPRTERDTIHAWLQECPACGFVSADISVASEPEIAAFNAGVGALGDAEPGSGAELMQRFQRRAAIENVLGDLRAAGFRSLNAAWVADDHDLPEAIERRREAADCYSRYLATDPPDEEANHLGVMLIDILRRAEVWDEAEGYCDWLAARDTRPIVQTIVRFQGEAIARRDAAVHTMKDLEAARV
ncbi:MAG: hypothetical protein IT534_03030 [Bauldia sp.]|nr:hypothetical protein [Bauldia sp.]